MQLIATKLQCISIHAPRTGSDRRRGHGLPHGVISIHAPRTGSDGRGASAAVGQARFQSTLPARGATHAQKAVVLTLPISIHAPRTGSDTVLAPSRTQSNDFNPRSPHGERLRLHQRRRFQLLFQSTLPARGATSLTSASRHECRDFNPRSPHGERRSRDRLQWRRSGISIHAPRTGSDRRCTTRTSTLWRISIHAPRTGSDGLQFQPAGKPMRFQSTLPARGATNQAGFPGRKEGISIHAPRTGSDIVPPHFVIQHLLFQSTLPARGATYTLSEYPCVSGISIHAPRTGSDCIDTNTFSPRPNFNPRSPHGERRIHVDCSVLSNQYFNPRSPHGERLKTMQTDSSGFSFQSTLPARGATTVTTPIDPRH